MKNWKDYLETVILAVFLALLIRTFVLSGYKVPTSSMAPSLIPGDFIFASRLHYGLRVPFTTTKIFSRLPDRGEVVVFNYPDQPRVHYVKRVIGLPGDKVEIKAGRLSLNDELFELTELEQIPSTEALLRDMPKEFTEYFKIFREKHKEQKRWISLQKAGTLKDFGPFIVPPNEVFLLGDNRDSSDDSRYWGTVPINHIEAKVLCIWLSLDWSGKSESFFRWHRVGDVLSRTP